MGIKVRGSSETQNLENSWKFNFVDGLPSDCLKIFRMRYSENFFQLRERAPKYIETMIHGLKKDFLHTLSSTTIKSIKQKIDHRYELSVGVLNTALFIASRHFLNL